MTILINDTTFGLGEVNQTIRATFRGIQLRIAGEQIVFNVYTDENWGTESKSYNYICCSGNFDILPTEQKINSFYYFAYFLNKATTFSIRNSFKVGDQERPELIVYVIMGSENDLKLINEEKAKWDNLGYTWEYLYNSGLINDKDKITDIKWKIEKGINKDGGKEFPKTDPRTTSPIKEQPKQEDNQGQGKGWTPRPPITKDGDQGETPIIDNTTWDTRDLSIISTDFKSDIPLTITSITTLNADNLLGKRDSQIKYYQVNFKEKIIHERETNNYIYLIANYSNGYSLLLNTNITDYLNSIINKPTIINFKRFVYDELLNMEKRQRLYALPNPEQEANVDISDELLNIKKKTLISNIISFSSNFGVGNASIQHKYNPIDYQEIIDKKVNLNNLELSEQTLKEVVLLIAFYKLLEHSQELDKSPNIIDMNDVSRLITNLEKVNGEFQKLSKVSPTNNPLYIGYLDKFDTQKELIKELLEKWKKRMNP